MPELSDQLGRKVHCVDPPQRIVSLVPSQTELLYDLGLEEKVVGITKFCVHPKHWLKEKTIIGGTKQVRLQTIKDLKPDLIVANKEENTQEMVLELEQCAPVYVSDVHDLTTALQMVQDIGGLTGTKQKAEQIAKKIHVEFQSLKQISPKRSALYLIWKNPYMVAGSGTFINDMMSRVGLRNLIQTARYPKISVEKMIEMNPEVILLSSEPFPFKAKHVEEIKAFLPQAKVGLVDGEMFSWYGSRLVKSGDELKRIQEMLMN